jgi:predicted acyltransferase (DUF342 family)
MRLTRLTQRSHSALGLQTLVVLLLLTGCGVGVNRSFHIPDGTRRETGVMTVNGRIEIGSDCSIQGDCHTVNGRIELGDNSEAGDMQTVNGRVTVGSGCTVNGDVGTVNGKATVGQGTIVHGEVNTVNGSIKLKGASVDGDVGTVNGDIELTSQAEVGGDVVVSGGKSSSAIEVRVFEGSVIHGDVRVEGRREVRVILAGGGEVRGQIRGAEVVNEDIVTELEATEQ